MSQVINTVLGRYEGGHVYVDRSGSEPQRELYVELGGVEDRNTAIGLCERIISERRTPGHAVVYGGYFEEPQHLPTQGFSLGDKVGGQMVLSYTLRSDDDGTAVLPEFVRPVDQRLAALDRQIARAGAGLTSEYARPSIQPADTGTGTDTTPPEFSQDDVVVGDSPAWRATRPYWCCWFDVNIENPGFSSTVVALSIPGGPDVAVVTLLGGGGRGIARVNRGWKVGERMICRTITAGAGAKGLTASVRGTMI